MATGRSTRSESLEVFYASKDGAGQIGIVGGRRADGRLWSLSIDALVEAIERGERYYVRTPTETLLLTARRNAHGKPEINVGLGSDGLLATLPRLPDGE